MATSPDLSIVVPVYNEEDVISIFLATVQGILASAEVSYEIVFINDGSKDATYQVVSAAHAADNRIKLLDLSRNFGKEAALSAGLEHAKGRAIVPIDVDLQDPPELILEMLALWREGYEVVLAKRSDRATDSRSKRLSSQLFYSLIERMSDVPIPDNVGDFRLMDRKVVDALLHLPERTRFMKGIFAWLGFRQAVVNYARPVRVAGTTKWKPLALWRLALEGIVSFSSFPLKLSSYTGAIFATVAFAYGGFITMRTILFGVDLPGYASVITLIMFFNGIILLSLGIIGEYLARVFIEVKGRPIYLVREKLD